jgi:starvation-inducible DNA-binding protein
LAPCSGVFDDGSGATTEFRSRSRAGQDRLCARGGACPGSKLRKAGRARRDAGVQARPLLSKKGAREVPAMVVGAFVVAPRKDGPMFPTSSTLPDEDRARIIDTLNDRLADGLDLYSQLKVAHWNVRGLQFPSLHALFETLATHLAEHNDAIAERAVTLGGRARGTVRAVAATTTLLDYPAETSRDIHHIRLLADRIEVYLRGLRASRVMVEELDDRESAALLSVVIGDFEKHHWFLRASQEG